MSTHYNGTELPPFRVTAFWVYGSGHSPLSPAGPSPFPNWPLPRSLPRREGAWSPRYPYGQDVGCLLSHYICVFISSNALWNLSGADHLWVLICAQKGSVKSVRSVREKLPFVRERIILCARKRYPLWERRISSVRERTTQRCKLCATLWAKSLLQRINFVLSHREGTLYFSYRSTDNYRNAPVKRGTLSSFSLQTSGWNGDCSAVGRIRTAIKFGFSVKCVDC